MRKSKAAWKEVTSSGDWNASIPAEDVPRGGKIMLTLSCGHLVARTRAELRKTGVPKRAHCPTCPEE